MILLALVFSLSPFAHAREDSVPGSRYTTGRGSALGDAFLPLVEDGSALFYNPAGLGKIRRTQLEVINFQVHGNLDYFDILDRNFYKVTELKQWAPTVSGREGKRPGVGAAFFPNFFFRGFAFGVLAQSQISSIASGSDITYRSRYQLIPTVGGALRLASGVVRLGYSLQWVNQASGEVTVPLSSETLSYNQLLRKGSAISHNIGFALTLPVSYLPALNLVARNVLDARYNSFMILPIAPNSVGEPDTEPMTFDASLSIQPKIGKGGYFNLVLQYRDVTNRSGLPVLMRAAIGLEFSFRDQFYLRGGVGSGYPSAGIGLRRKTAEFSLTWFTEELGTTFRERSDPKFMLQYQIRAF